jgi:hypothetical protein
LSYDLELAAPGITQQLIKPWTLRLRAGDAVGVLGHDVEATLRAIARRS